MENLKTFWLYHLLLEQKASGVVYDFKQITESQLEELSWYHDIVDSAIADLYDVTREAVYRKRARWDMQLRNRPLLYKHLYPMTDWERIVMVFPELKHIENPFSTM